MYGNQQLNVSQKFTIYYQQNQQYAQGIGQYQQLIGNLNGQLDSYQHQERVLNEEASRKHGFQMNELIAQQQRDTQNKMTEYKQLLKQVYEKENQDIISYQPMDLSSLYLFSQPVTKEDHELAHRDYTLPAFEMPNTIDDVVNGYKQQLLQMVSASQCSLMTKFQKNEMAKNDFIGAMNQIIEGCVLKGFKTMFTFQTSCGNIFALLYQRNNTGFSINAIKFVSPMENDFDKLPSVVSLQPLQPLQGPQIILPKKVQLDRLSFTLDSECSLIADPQFPSDSYYLLPHWENINVYFFQ